MILYHKVSALLAMKLAGSYNKSLENLPSTQDALLQHARGAVFQANIWTTSLQNIIFQHGSSWKPIWMTLPEAARACNEVHKRLQYSMQVC